MLWLLIGMLYCWGSFRRELEIVCQSMSADSSLFVVATEEMA